jgi:hypothetical protein
MSNKQIRFFYYFFNFLSFLKKKVDSNIQQEKEK